MANITAACPVCGKVFTRPCKPRADGRYLCSRACAGAWRKLHPICTGKRRDRAWDEVRIQITAIIPVYPAMRPRIGEVYDAEKYEYISSMPGYVVRVGNKRQVRQSAEIRSGKTRREGTLLMDKYWGKAKDGRYICPVCNEKFDEDLLSTGKCPNCGFHEQGGLKPKIKGAKYDDGKPRPSLVPVAAIEAIMQVREFGKAKYADAEDWRKVPREKWLDALLRHVLHIWDNPLALDYESGLPALWHVITNAAFLCAAYKDELDKARGEWAKDVLDEKAVDGCKNSQCAYFSTTCGCIRYNDVSHCKKRKGVRRE